MEKRREVYLKKRFSIKLVKIGIQLFKYEYYLPVFSPKFVAIDGGEFLVFLFLWCYLLKHSYVS